MKPRITVITIGVDDLERSLRFYRDGLGLKTEGIIGKEFEHGAVAFFDLQAGLKLAIWPRKSLAHDSGLALGMTSATEFSMGHNVASKTEVDEVMAQAKRAGASIVKPAKACRHFSRNPTGYPYLPRERKIGDKYAFSGPRRPASAMFRTSRSPWLPQ